MDLPFTVPFTARDVESAGLPQQALREWIQSGSVRRVLRGVYCPASLDDDLVVRASCAALILPPHCVMVERTAAWLHGINVHAPDERYTVPDLEVVSLRGHPVSRRVGVYAGTRDLVERDLMRLGTVKVTTPLRTALDLAMLRGELGALASLDAFMRHHGITHPQMMLELPRLRGRRGVVQLRRLIPLATPLAESPGESWLRGTILQAGLEAPEPQVTITAGGRFLGRVDLAYRDRKVIVEYNGEEFHGPDQEQDDADRRRQMTDAGWHVIAVRKEQMRGAAREAWLDELRALLVPPPGPRGKRRYPPGQKLR